MSVESRVAGVDYICQAATAFTMLFNFLARQVETRGGLRFSLHSAAVCELPPFLSVTSKFQVQPGRKEPAEKTQCFN